MKILLTPIEKKALEKRHKKERNVNKKDCIKAVLLHDEGWDIALIAQALRIKPPKVTQYLQNYKAILLEEHAIHNLTEFNDPNTLIFLYDRTLYIERLIKTIEAIGALPSLSGGIEVFNLLSQYNVPFMDVRFSLTELVHVLYRSMFQKTTWESGIVKYISTNAYSYDDQHKTLHKKFIDLVNCKLAHQDNLKAVALNLRYVYEINKEHGIEQTATLTAIKNHASELISLIFLMKIAILKTFKDKFGKDLPIIIPYEPLQKRT